jgi:hypothetical protein
MSDDLFTGGGGDRAYARRYDPGTSHQAADAVSPDLKALQARVADFARRAGQSRFTDAQMEDELGDAGSTLRSRRSELTARNIILDSGLTRTYGYSTRQRIVWVHRDFVPNAPPVCEPAKPATDEERAEAREMASKLARFAVSMMREGRAMFSNELALAAELMRKLAA